MVRTEANLFVITQKPFVGLCREETNAYKYATAKEMQAVIVRHLQPLAIASAMHFLVLLDSKKRGQ